MHFPRDRECGRAEYDGSPGAYHLSDRDFEQPLDKVAPEGELAFERGGPM